MRNLDSCRCWRCTFCPCKVRNKFLVNFWNRTILLGIPCICPALRWTRHAIYNVLCRFFLSFCHVVMAGRMLELCGNLLLNFRAETSPINDEQSSPVNVYQFNLLVPTNAPIVLIYISPYLVATCFGWSPSSVHVNNSKKPINKFMCRVEPGYNDIGLYDTSSILSDILWYQLNPRC